ncbi:MAG: hypothetical protein C0508_18190 [Cyanobacteria bacterium PR.023]|nr:hypothetical protein [Cyanobacteria bacterium PR.023]
MNTLNVCDLFLIGWFSVKRIFALQSERGDRFESAAITHTRLKTITSKKFVPVVFESIPEGTTLQNSGVNNNGMPHLHEFREVLGVDPVVPMTADREKPLSHISQYRLAVYVSGLTEQERALVYEGLTASAQCA